VLSGGLEVEGMPTPAGRAYYFFPPNEPIPALRAVRPTDVYVNFGSGLT
jgi:hypothetical protein